MIWKLGRTVCVYSTSTGGGFAAPRIRNVDHGGLVTISGRSPRLLLCVHHCVSWFGAAVYLPLCICSCVSATVYLPLCLLCCISTTVSAAVHLPLCIRCCVSAAVYLPLCILNYFCISAAVNMYSALVLYIWLYICHCIYILHCISATLSAVLLRVIEYKEGLNYLSYKSDCLPNYLMAESMPLYA